VNPGDVYTSIDSGTNWIARNVFGGFGSWGTVASSADGTKLFAAAHNSSGVLLSIDSGTNWTPHLTDRSRNWNSSASSADGLRLVALDYGGQIWTSVDAGTNWLSHESNRSWYTVASSSDGTKLAAGINVGPGQIYTSAPINVATTTTGTAGYLIGTQNSAVELQFVGSGQWIPISSAGVVQAF